MGLNVFATWEYVASKITELLGIHNKDDTAHQDMRNQINVLSVDRGYLISKKVSGDIRELNTNGKFWCSSSDTINLPPQTGGERTYTVDVTTYLPNRLAIELVCIYDSVDSSNQGVTFSSSQTSRGWTSWKEVATTDVTNNFLTNQQFNQWGNISGTASGELLLGSNLKSIAGDPTIKYAYTHPHTGMGIRLTLDKKAELIIPKDASAVMDTVVNYDVARIATTTKTDVTPNTGWTIAFSCMATGVVIGDMYFFNALVQGDGTNTHPFKLPYIPRNTSGTALYASATATGNDTYSKYLIVKPDGWLDFQTGYVVNKIYAITVAMPI